MFRGQKKHTPDKLRSHFCDLSLFGGTIPPDTLRFQPDKLRFAPDKLRFALDKLR